MVDAGQFQAAGAAIGRALAAPGLASADRQALLFQRERMHRIALDFTLDADALKARIRQQIPDLRDEEFRRWDAHGLLEHMVIDGRTLYFKRDASNLFRLSDEAAMRRAHPAPFDDDPMGALNDYHRKVRHAALKEQRSSVEPHRVRITQTLTVDADAVPAGQVVRAWIPYPKPLPGQQEDIRYVASEPARHELAPADAPQRTAYFEKTAQAGKPTAFSVTYELTLDAQYHVIDPANVVPAKITPELAPYVAERPPHVVFTEQMRLFSRQVVGDETNPYRIAQKLFAAVDEIPWAGAREYSTIPNISDYALHAGHADCGQQTLLLITLLRMNGIPARWQSGAIFAPGGYDDIHDWGQLYLAPYGWVPMDVTFGRLRPGAHPKPGDDALEWFYLGGLDAWRVAFNSDFGQPLVPAKRHFRSDTVDSQRGEVEWSGGNLYYDQWHYGFTWTPVGAPATTTTQGSAHR
ncbi:transglutaminase domain-containing protein [Fulvimonas sp. R45]|uniref:transglutaminase-like domain-containing protein n=1 Tax=Fulvimonas sp. R45 TaxID=3045937 RepID=UPI00265E2B19|nr:transglutaminase domain-containing protein [Fulvimonas sp. R45]MDO1528495.1 transglutaminase domain-containing protein [Fulvimonas sp. R45]